MEELSPKMRNKERIRGVRSGQKEVGSRMMKTEEG